MATDLGNLQARTGILSDFEFARYKTAKQKASPVMSGIKRLPINQISGLKNITSTELIPKRVWMSASTIFNVKKIITYVDSPPNKVNESA